MENIIKIFTDMFSQYGWELTLIALIGVVILGILKYSNAFKKVDEKYRHYIYIGISVAFSLIASGVYLAIQGCFDINGLFALGTIIFGLNQAIYAIYANTPLKELICKLLEEIKKLIEKK